MSKSIPILILAAGSSKRMEGRIKQLLRWKDTTLLKHAIQQARLITDNIYIVLGANADTIKATIPKEDIVFNPDWKLGIGSSISAGIEFVLKKNQVIDGLLIMLADQPLLDTSYLKKLMDTFINENPKIVATAYEERVGVPAIFTFKVLPELLNLNEDFGAKNIIKKYRCSTITVQPNGKEIDIDTPNDYSQLIEKMNT